MTRSSVKILYALLIAAIFITIWKSKEKPAEITPPEIQIFKEPEEKEFKLVKHSFQDLKNWQNDNQKDLIKAFALSCSKIKHSKSEFLSNSETKIPTKEYQDLCEYFLHEKIKTSKEFKRFVEDNFTPYLVTFNNSEKGKFTSYYEAAIHVSAAKTPHYKYPIYGRPKDLIEFNPHDFDEKADNKRYVGRVKGTKLVPYYTREEIEKSGFDAPVLMWGNSLVDIHITQIQGSAVAHFPDGTKTRVGYADNNGLPFKGIGSILLEKKLITSGQASMGKIKKWLNEKGNEAVSYLNENKRYIFFRIVGKEGPIGAQGVPLTPQKSLAVDTNYIPLGSLLWLETTGPDKEKIETLAIAQDIGSAIKGAVRGDFFWGSGHDDILELAGKMNSEGKYYIMLPNTMELKNEEN